MALLVVRPRCCFPLRLLMASSSSSSRFLSYSPSLTSSFPFTHRVKFRLKRVSSGAVSRNVAFPRAFMSSSTATEPSPARKASDSYGSEQIQVSEGLDPVRKRPGMYIGSTGRRGLHHLVYEILDNGVDEAQAGFASWIDVILLADNSVCITDNGRGVLHAGGKFGGSSSGYSVSGGLHVVGLSVVNALSEALEVTVWRDGMEYKQKYARGKPITDMSCHVLSPNSEDRRGTCIKFRPDREIFTTEIEFDYDTIAGRIRELAFLNPKLTIALSKESEDPEKNQYNEYYYAGGLVEYVNWLNTDKRPIHDVFGFHKEVDGVTIDAALQWSADAYSDTILGYANSIRTVDGGTHIDGFKASLTRTINNLGNKSKANKDKELTLSGEHIREGLTCVIAVKVPNPEFEGQTNTRLGNPEVRKVVDQCVQDYLSDYLELHPDVLENILSKALNALKAALAAKRAREVLRQKSVLKSSSLHGKLADCFATNPEEAGMMFMPKRSGEFVQPKVVEHCPKVTWKQETMNVKKSKMGFPLGVMELEISPSREAKDNCIRESICESENAKSRLMSLSSATGSHHFATTTIDEEANIDQMKQLSGEELHEFDDVARDALYANNGLSSKKDFSDKLLSKESKGVSPSSTMGGKQITRKSKKTKSANGLSSVKELDEFPLLQETSFVSETSAQLDGLDDAQMGDQQKLRTRLCSIFEKVLVVDNVALARKVVQMLTHQYRQHIHACDTEVSEIDVKQETPVDHGEIICFSIYSGKDVDFGNGKTCIWVDVLDGGGQDILAEFAPFFEDSTIKKVWHNYSFDCHVVENYGIKLSGFLADTMHMARLWDSSRRTDGGYSLEALTSNPDVMFENKRSQDEDLIGKISMKAIFGRRKQKKDGSLGKAVSLPSVEELQKEERLPWICYSSLDAMSTLKLYESLKSKLSKMPWVMNSTCKGNMLHFYENYWRPFGKILVQMETEGMLVDRSYLSEVEKVAIAQQKVAADRFRNWASKYCTDARFMNVGSDSQLRTLLFGGICNRKNHNEGLPTEKKFKVPNIENLIEEGKKTPKKYRDITLHKIGSNLQTDFYTLSGWPSVSGDALKAIAGKVSAEYDFSNDTPEDLLPDDPLDSGRKDVDISAYGTAYAAFGGGQEGREACHAIAALIEVCSIDSLISNFILPLQGSHVSGRNGRIHCSLNINTETGRLSARRPNLQNQPALEKDRYKIRQAFVASPGNSLIVADYGQLELRILAHLADCKSMKEAFEAGGDFHSRTAMNMYPYIREAVEREEVILEWHPQPGEEKPPVPLLKDAFGSERRKAKMLNFSIAYGKTPMGLAKDWKVSVKEAKGTVDLWYKERQEVLKWQEARKKEAAKRSCVHTLLGRARRFPSMANASPPQRSHIERAAINTPVQGSAADVAMCAMLEIDSNKRLKELGWKLLLQVHDEVILEGPSETEEEAKGLVIECMSKPFNGRNILTVELAVDAKCAQNWYAAK